MAVLDAHAEDAGVVVVVAVDVAGFVVGVVVVGAEPEVGALKCAVIVVVVAAATVAVGLAVAVVLEDLRLTNP